MRYVKWTAGLAGLAGALAIAAIPARATDTASLSGCTTLQSQVRTALQSNAQSPNYDSALKEQRYGLEFCSNGFFQNGVSHYEQALKLLGVDKT